MFGVCQICQISCCLTSDQLTKIPCALNYVYLICYFAERWKLCTSCGCRQGADTVSVAVAVGTLAGQGGGKLAVALYGTKCVVYVEGTLW